MTTFKQVFNEHINQDEIKDNVLYSKKKSFVLKPVLAVCLLLIGIFSYQNQPLDQIHINKISSQISSDLDVVIKQNSLNSNALHEQFPFLEKLENLDYQWDIYLMYVREDRSSNEYNILHDYVFTLDDESSRIEISFSLISQPLRCSLIDSKNYKVSKVKDVDMIFQQLNDSYYVTFENNGIYFDIESRNVEIDELIEIIEIIIES